MKYLIQLSMVVLLFIAFTSCDNDDGMAANQNQCNYEGLTFFDGSTNTLLPAPVSAAPASLPIAVTETAVVSAVPALYPTNT